MQLLIDGQWRDARSGKSIPVRNPATGDVIGNVAHADVPDLDYALTAAQEGFATWRSTPACERGAIMRRAAALLRERADERNFPGIQVLFIHGNHDADSYEAWMCLHDAGEAVAIPVQLLRFNRQFVPLADLAKALGTRASAAAKHVEGLAVIGAKPLPNGTRRGGLVRLADLVTLAFIGARK